MSGLEKCSFGGLLFNAAVISHAGLSVNSLLWFVAWLVMWIIVPRRERAAPGAPEEQKK